MKECQTFHMDNNSLKNPANRIWIQLIQRIKFKDLKWSKMPEEITLTLESLELPTVEPFKLFKVVVEMPLIHWFYLKPIWVKEETIVSKMQRILNMLTSSFGALIRIMIPLTKTFTRTKETLREWMWLTRWFKSKNSQTLIMENFRQITWALQRIITLNTKPETYQRRDKNKRK